MAMINVMNKTYSLQYAEINSTSSPRVVDYKFQKTVIMLMLKGEKKVKYNNKEFTIGPNTIFIPPANTSIQVTIENVTETVECLTLDISNDFLKQMHTELVNQHAVHLESDENDSYLDKHYFSAHQNLHAAFMRLYKLKSNKNQRDQFLENLTLKELLYRLLRSDARNRILDTKESDEICQSIRYIKNNYHKQIYIAELAKIACKSESGYYKFFKEKFGCSPNQYITLERLKQATKELKNTTKSVIDIALDCGFNSLEHFSRTFKNAEGLSPKKFRQSIQMQPLAAIA